MKTLKQIIEGAVVMSDFKLDKKGRKYKAHRMSMGDNGVKEDTMRDGKWTSDAPRKGEVPSPDEGWRPPKSSKPVKKKPQPGSTTKAMDDESMDEEVEQVDELNKSTLRSYLKKAVPSHGDEEFISRVSKNPEEKAISKRKAGNRAVGIIRANRGLKSAHVATMKEEDDLEEGMQQTLRKYVPGYAKRQLNKKMDAQAYAPGDSTKKTVDKDVNYGRYKKVYDKLNNEDVGHDVNPYDDILEARGRPPSAATLAKRAAAASAKPRDDDEGEQYDADSGVEADQHIHVQLKKAADSDQKPFEVSFKNGKKHTVSQKVAKDVLSATERLKPEHRKNVHDEIHQSYDNLMSVHRLVARK